MEIKEEVQLIRKGNLKELNINMILLLTMMEILIYMVALPLSSSMLKLDYRGYNGCKSTTNY